MINRLTTPDETAPLEVSPRQELVAVLETYLADLERGVLPDEQKLLDAHPDLADELRPYLESLRLLDGATRDIRLPVVKKHDESGEAAPPVARQIGEYRVVREIGRGGMGIVYEAHQKSLNRQVALKILPFAAVLDQRQIARFRNEAQAAAQLHHPHIVPVFAVGQEQGVYYYAMQYIDGQSLEQAITELRSTQPVSTANTTKVRGAAAGSTTTLHCGPASAALPKHSIQRGEIFRTIARLAHQAADALQHAHEHGILHRDIKPSNLLIDGTGKLWITDFGLARIQNDNGVTLTGDVVGTLRYMSPEQASGTAVVDARTDVYSLGVTIYELLTQTQAHPGDDRQTLLRKIIDEDPIAPRKINPAVPIDLETIVLGAMAKSRDERYPSAKALADDLERFLEGKPTLARRPTLVDRMGKWARRHRSLVAIAAAAVVLLSAVSAVGVVLLAREQARTSAALADAEANARRAQDNFERAERHFRQARSAVDQLGAQLSDRLVELPGTESVRRDLLLDTMGYYRQFALDAGRDPQLRQETALACFKSAVIAAKLGAVTDAIKEYETSQGLLKELIAADPTRIEPRAQLAVLHNNLGLLYANRAETQRARQEYDEAIALRKQLAEEHSDDVSLAGALAESQANLGLLLDQLGDAARAERSLRGSVAALRPLADAHPEQPKVVHDLAIACNNLSFVLRNQDPAAAEKSSHEAIALLERLEHQSAKSSDYHEDLALCYNNLAALESKKEDWAEAVASHQRAIELQEQLVRKSPGVVRHRSNLAISLNNLGMASCRAGKSAEADAAFDRARDLFATLANDFPDELSYRSSLAAQLNNQALALASAGRHEDAIKVYPAAIESQQACRGRLPNSETMRDLLSKMYYNFGQSLRAKGHWRETADTVRARRQLWTGNGERLLGVAAELADLAEAMKPHAADSSGGPTSQELATIDAEVLTTLQQAFDSGWPRNIDVAAEERFASLQKNETFAAKIAELNQISSDSVASQGEVGASSHTEKN